MQYTSLSVLTTSSALLKLARCSIDLVAKSFDEPVNRSQGRSRIRPGGVGSVKIDPMAAEMSWCWGVLSSWLLSPGAAWFLFFNAVVGAVAVLSWGAHHQGGDGTAAVARRRRLTRSASSMVMERLRSMSTAVFPAFHVQEYNTFQEEDQAEEIKKIVEPAVAAGEISCRARTMAPPLISSPVAAAAAAAAEERGPAAASTSSGNEEAEPAVASKRDEEAAAAAAAVERGRKSEPEEEFPLVCAERCRGREYGEVEEKAEVNARAERFIRQFRADLKLERINSILNKSRYAGGRAAPVR